ncbi:hypothetical protein [Chengkuizengella marina]|uniref:Uncharacterized protein n=1 Tax=Chengkuizengella marina TaxID=2507566 RepID=A0A6N9PZI1_9BACL|nr:hypothetical protein [Chengkuizengella marina]NBI28222.1 hypothetical protein [Chengkuizengella marina]
MGLKKVPFVVDNTVSVDDPYNFGDPKVILLLDDPTVVLSVDVCVKQPQKTKVLLDSMAQIAVRDGGIPISFEVSFELLRNGTRIALINDEMDYVPAGSTGRHTNFPNLPLVDNDPSPGINKYDVVCTLVSNISGASIFVGSRSLKATIV